jgi:dCTP deaminase
MLLSDKEIAYNALGHALISPYKDEQLQPCSYDVLLSDELLHFSGSKTGSIDASTKTLTGIKYNTISLNDSDYIMKPGDFVLGSTIEKVNIPNNMAARFEGKSSLGRLGLTTHITAGFIDAGFSGTITLEMKNENEFPIKISKGMKIGQLCFFKIDEDVARPYGSDSLDSHYNNQDGTTPAK